MLAIRVVEEMRPWRKESRMAVFTSWDMPKSSALMMSFMGFLFS